MIDNTNQKNKTELKIRLKNNDRSEQLIRLLKNE